MDDQKQFKVKMGVKIALDITIRVGTFIAKYVMTESKINCQKKDLDFSNR